MRRTLPKFIRGIIIALGTLTSLPMPDPGEDNLAPSLPWFPLVGLLIGSGLFVFGFLWRLLSLPEWPGGLALVMVLLGILFTRALHLDGLADWADSFGAINNRERKLAIMKDASIGAFGVIALVVVLLAKWVFFERILVKDMMIWVPLVFILPRTGMAELISTLPYARSETGTAGPFVKGALPGHRLMAHVFTLFLCLFYGPAGFMYYALSLLIVFPYKKYCHRVFGGITGDLLGTANEILETSLLFVLALFGGYLQPYPGWSWLF